MWQVKWFRWGITIFSAIIAAILIIVVLNFFYFKTDDKSPTPSPEFNTPLPSLRGELPEPKTLGIKTKAESQDPILMYHHVVNIFSVKSSLEKGLSISLEDFRAQMQYLFDSGYRSATLSELFNDTNEKRVIITFDDGYEDVFIYAYPILKKIGYRATIFIITDSAGKPGYMNWEKINKLVAEGWEIGSHSLNHPNLKNSSIDIVQKQIFESKKIIEKKINLKVEFFSYPAGKYNQEMIPLLQSVGYVGAVTTEQGTINSKNNIFELKRLRISGFDTISSFKSKIKQQ